MDLSTLLFASSPLTVCLALFRYFGDRSFYSYHPFTSGRGDPLPSSPGASDFGPRLGGRGRVPDHRGRRRHAAVRGRGRRGPRQVSSTAHRGRPSSAKHPGAQAATPVTEGVPHSA